MPTNAIAPATAASNSSDITVAAGSAVTVGLCTAAGGPIPHENLPVKITRKNAAGTYDEVGLYLTAQVPALRLDSPGVYRAEKPVTSVAIGVNQD